MDSEKAEEIIGYPFINRNLLEEALTTPGSVIVKNSLANRDHRDLGILGSALIKMIILADWYPTGQDRKQAMQTVIRVSDSVHLANVAQQSGVAGCITINNSQRGQPLGVTLLKTTTEAIIAAVYHDSDCGISVSRSVMQRLEIV